MNDFLSLTVMAVALVGVLALMLRGLRPRGGPGSAGARRWTHLRRYREHDRVGGWITGLVTALALTAFTNAIAAGAAATTAIAALTGAAFAAFNAAGAARTSSLVAGGAGLLGIVATLIGLVQSTNCDASPFFLRVVTFTLLLVVGALSFAARSLAGKRVKLMPLAVFAALEVLGFLSGPFGVTPFRSENPTFAVGVAIVAAAGFGALAGFAPRLAIGLGSVAIALTGIGVAAGFGDCGTNGSNASTLIALACFSALYAVMSILAAPLRKLNA